MDVTNVKLTKYNKGSMLAFAAVEFDNCITVKGWKLFKGREGRDYDIGFPAEKDPVKKNDDGSPKYWPSVFIDLKTQSGKNILDQIKDKIAAAYNGDEDSSQNTQNTNQGTHNDDGQDWSGGGYEDDDIPF